MVIKNKLFVFSIVILLSSFCVTKGSEWDINISECNTLFLIHRLHHLKVRQMAIKGHKDKRTFCEKSCERLPWVHSSIDVTLDSLRARKDKVYSSKSCCQIKEINRALKQRMQKDSDWQADKGDNLLLADWAQKHEEEQRPHRHLSLPFYGRRRANTHSGVTVDRETSTSRLRRRHTVSTEHLKNEDGTIYWRDELTGDLEEPEEHSTYSIPVKSVLHHHPQAVQEALHRSPSSENLAGLVTEDSQASYAALEQAANRAKKLHKELSDKEARPAQAHKSTSSLDLAAFAAAVCNPITMQVTDV